MCWAESFSLSYARIYPKLVGFPNSQLTLIMAKLSHLLLVVHEVHANLRRTHHPPPLNAYKNLTQTAPGWNKQLISARTLVTWYSVAWQGSISRERLVEFDKQPSCNPRNTPDSDSVVVKENTWFSSLIWFFFSRYFFSVLRTLKKGSWKRKDIKRPPRALHIPSTYLSPRQEYDTFQQPYKIQELLITECENLIRRITWKETIKKYHMLMDGYPAEYDTLACHTLMWQWQYWFQIANNVSGVIKIYIINIY